MQKLRQYMNGLSKKENAATKKEIITLINIQLQLLGQKKRIAQGTIEQKCSYYFKTMWRLMLAQNGHSKSK